MCCQLYARCHYDYALTFHYPLQAVDHTPAQYQAAVAATASVKEDLRRAQSECERLQGVCEEREETVAGACGRMGKWQWASVGVVWEISAYTVPVV
jgi:hypothetical protein